MKCGRRWFRAVGHSRRARYRHCSGTAQSIADTRKGHPVLPTDITIIGWLEVIRAENNEIPGLHSSMPQVERLWDLDAVTCDALLWALVEAELLKRARRDAYLRAS